MKVLKVLNPMNWVRWLSPREVSPPSIPVKINVTSYEEKRRFQSAVDQIKSKGRNAT